MYPIDLSADYGDGTRSRGLGLAGVLLFPKMLMAIPHMLILYVLGAAAAIIAWVGYWVIVITGELPEFFHTFPQRVIAWQTRTLGWVAALTDAYPPFEWEPDAPAVQFTVTEGPGPRSRGLAVLGITQVLKALALLPHAIVVAFVALATYLAVWVGFWAILFTGRLPRGIFDLTTGLLRWVTRLSAWMYSLTDRYPPFTLQS